MYNPDLEPKDIYGNMFAAAILLEQLENLAMQKEFSERLHKLTEQAWASFPSRFIVEFPED